MRAARSPAAPGRVFCSDRRLLQIWGREGRGPERLKEGARMNQLQASKLVCRAHPVPQARMAVPFRASVARVVPTFEPFAYSAHTDARLPFPVGHKTRHQKAWRSPDSLSGGCFNGVSRDIARIGRPRGLVLNLWLGKWPAPGPLKIPRSQLGGTSHRAALCHMPLNRMSLS